MFLNRRDLNELGMILLFCCRRTKIFLRKCFLSGLEPTKNLVFANQLALLKCDKIIFTKRLGRQDCDNFVLSLNGKKKKPNSKRVFKIIIFNHHVHGMPFEGIFSIIIKLCRGFPRKLSQIRNGKEITCNKKPMN